MITIHPARERIIKNLITVLVIVLAEAGMGMGDRIFSCVIVERLLRLLLTVR